MRRAALDAVQAGDDSAVRSVVHALDDPATAGAAAAAIARLGDAVVPVLAARLDDPEVAAGAPDVRRLVCSAGGGTVARDDVLARHVGHPDRELGLLVQERLVRAGPAAERVASALDVALEDDLRHAARILGALVALDGSEDPLVRALADERDLVRQRIRVNRTARFGEARVGPAFLALSEGGERQGLAVEAVEVALGPAEARRLLPLLDPGVGPAEALSRPGPAWGGGPRPRGGAPRPRRGSGCRVALALAPRLRDSRRTRRRPAGLIRPGGRARRRGPGRRRGARCGGVKTGRADE